MISSTISLGVQNVKITFESTTKRVQLQKDLETQMVTILKSFDLLSSRLSYRLVYEHVGVQKGIKTNSDFQIYVQQINQKQQVKLILFKSDLKHDLISEKEEDLKTIHKLNETIIIEKDQKENFKRQYEESNKDESKLATLIQEQLKSLELGLYDQLHSSKVKPNANSCLNITQSDIFRTKNPKASRVEVSCSLCKGKMKHPFIFYCNNPKCFELVICPYCEDQHANEDESEHILIKSYKVLRLKPGQDDTAVAESILLSPKKEANSISSKLTEKIPVSLNQISSNKDANHITNCLDSFFLEGKQTYVIKEGKNLNVILRIQNNGKVTWPMGCKLVMIPMNSNANIIGHENILKVKTLPNEITNLMITLLTSNKPKGEYTSLWQLQNDKSEPFGQIIKIFVQIV